MLSTPHWGLNTLSYSLRVSTVVAFCAALIGGGAVGAKAEITASVPAGVHWRASPEGMPLWGPNRFWTGSGLVLRCLGPGFTVLALGPGFRPIFIHSFTHCHHARTVLPESMPYRDALASNVLLLYSPMSRVLHVYHPYYHPTSIHSTVLSSMLVAELHHYSLR